LLKLKLPHALVDDDRARAEYDIEKNNGTVTCWIPKEEKGLHFENLDLISTLLAPSKTKGMPNLYK
jgi:protein SHQ1